MRILFFMGKFSHYCSTTGREKNVSDRIMSAPVIGLFDGHLQPLLENAAISRERNSTAIFTYETVITSDRGMEKRMMNDVERETNKNFSLVRIAN